MISFVYKFYLVSKLKIIFLFLDLDFSQLYRASSPHLNCFFCSPIASEL